MSVTFDDFFRNHFINNTVSSTGLLEGCKRIYFHQFHIIEMDFWKNMGSQDSVLHNAVSCWYKDLWGDTRNSQAGWKQIQLVTEKKAKKQARI